MICEILDFYLPSIFKGWIVNNFVLPNSEKYTYKANFYIDAPGKIFPFGENLSALVVAWLSWVVGTKVVYYRRIVYHGALIKAAIKL